MYTIIHEFGPTHLESSILQNILYLQVFDFQTREIVQNELKFRTRCRELSHSSLRLRGHELPEDRISIPEPSKSLLNQIEEVIADPTPTEAIKDS